MHAHTYVQLVSYHMFARAVLEVWWKLQSGRI